jgi:hypothetical protein
MQINPVRMLLVGAITISAQGCHSISSTRVESREQSVPLQRDAATADDYVAAIQCARTPAPEADAIRALRQWEVRNGFTYQIRTTRVEDNAPIESASVGAVPVRAQVTVYRGREVVRTFSFPVKDNRNLALFGE